MHETWCGPVRATQARLLPSLPEEGADEEDDGFLAGGLAPAAPLEAGTTAGKSSLVKED